MKPGQIFLSYAKEDRAKAIKLHRTLARHGLKLWFDEEVLIGGEQDWPSVIREAIRTSRYFIALMSSASVNKKGFVQKEIREALDVLDEYPPKDVYLIPVRLDECTPSHDRLRTVQYVDLFPEWKRGVSKLLRRFGISATAPPKTLPPSVRTDGLYVAHTEGPYWYHYLRFFPNRTVFAVPSGRGLAAMEPLMSDPSNPHPLIAVGKYSTRHGRVNFSTRSATGRVDYSGFVQGRTLIMRKYSYINGYRDIHEYEFIRTKPMREESHGPQPNHAMNRTRRKRRAG